VFRWVGRRYSFNLFLYWKNQWLCAQVTPVVLYPRFPTPTIVPILDPFQYCYANSRLNRRKAYCYNLVYTFHYKGLADQVGFKPTGSGNALVFFAHHVTYMLETSSHIWIGNSYICSVSPRRFRLDFFNPLKCKGNYIVTSNNIKLLHWPLTGALLHLVQRGGGLGWAGPQPAQAPPRCIKCNSRPSTASVPITVLPYNGPLLCGFNVPIKEFMLSHFRSSEHCMCRSVGCATQ